MILLRFLNHFFFALFGISTILKYFKERTKYGKSTKKELEAIRKYDKT